MKFEEMKFIMNEFIELRKSFCEENNPYVFLQLFFDKYIENNKNIKIEQENIIEKLQKLKDWGFKKILKAEDICEMLSRRARSSASAWLT